MPKRRRQEPEEEPSEPEEEQEENAGCEPITLDQLLPTITVEQFLAEYWGKKVYVGALSEDSYEAVRSRFCNGDFAAVLAECRKEDNTSYTDSERDEIEAGFRERKATVNQPFNFCDGAEDLRLSFIESCAGHGNDVEVGVYFSQTGGETTDWHFDNNHNLTVQVAGHKEWLHVAGDVNTVASRSLKDLATRPKNRHEQLVTIPPTHGATTCYNLQPGSVIYLPPGHWHAVSSVGQHESFSVDLRVGNVLKCKWAAECLFSAMLAKTRVGHELKAMGPGDYDGWGSTVDDMSHSKGFEKHPVGFELRSPMPTPMPRAMMIIPDRAQ